MKKILLFMLFLTGALFAATLIKLDEDEDTITLDGVASTSDLATKLNTNAVVQTTGTSTTDVMSQNAVTEAIGVETEARIDADDTLRQIITSGQALSYEFYISTNRYTAGEFGYTPTNAQYGFCSAQTTNVSSFTYTYTATNTYGYVAFCTNQVFYTNALGTAYFYDYASESVSGTITEKVELYAFEVGTTNSIEIGDVAIPLDVTAATTPVMRLFNIPYIAYSNTNGYYFGIKKKCTAKGGGTATVTQWAGDGYNTHLDLALPSSVLADFYVAKSAITTNVTSETDTVPSNKAVNDLFAAGIAIVTNPVVNSVSEGTTSNVVSGGGVKAEFENVWTETFGTLTNLHIGVYGQSYAIGSQEDGYGAYASVCTNAQTYATQTYLLNSTNPAIIATNFVVSRGTNNWSVEIFGAKTLHDISGLPSAWSIFGWDGAPTTLLGKGTGQYIAFSNVVERTKTDFGVGDIDVLLYLQGAGNVSRIGNVEADYTNMFNNLLADFNPKMILVMSPNDYTNNANWGLLRTKLEAVVGQYTNIFMLPTDGMPMNSDGSSHFNAEGYKQFGEMCAKQILAHLGAVRQKTPVYEPNQVFKTVEAKKLIAGEISASIAKTKTLQAETVDNAQKKDMYSGSTLILKASAGEVNPVIAGTNFKLWDRAVASQVSADGTNVTWKLLYSNTVYMATGQLVSVQGSNPTNYNGVWKITAVDAVNTNVTIACPVTNAYVNGCQLLRFFPLIEITTNGTHARPSAYLSADILHASNSAGELSSMVSFKMHYKLESGTNLSTVTNLSAVLPLRLTLGHARLNTGESFAGFYKTYYNGQNETSLAFLIYRYEWLGNDVTVRTPTEYLQ